MRTIREVLRLHYAAQMSIRAIARSLKASPATVGGYVRRAEVQGLGDCPKSAHLAATRIAQRCRAGAAAVPGAVAERDSAPATALE